MNSTKASLRTRLASKILSNTVRIGVEGVPDRFKADSQKMVQGQQKQHQNEDKNLNIKLT